MNFNISGGNTNYNVKAYSGSNKNKINFNFNNSFNIPKFDNIKAYDKTSINSNMNEYKAVYYEDSSDYSEQYDKDSTGNTISLDHEDNSAILAGSGFTHNNKDSTGNTIPLDHEDNSAILAGSGFTHNKKNVENGMSQYLWQLFDKITLGAFSYAIEKRGENYVKNFGKPEFYDSFFGSEYTYNQKTKFGLSNAVPIILFGKADGDSLNSFVKDFNKSHSQTQLLGTDSNGNPNSTSGILGKLQSAMSSSEYYNEKYKPGANQKFKDTTLVSGSFGTSGPRSLVHENFSDSYENNGFTADYNVDVYGLYAKASASWEVGPDHINLSASAEASVAHIETTGSVSKTLDTDYGEIDLLGAGFSGTADVGHVYANGKFTLGYADGKLDAGITAAIGAEACSASGTLDLDFLGFDTSVTGKVKIGVGAQLNAGIQDGKLQFNIGVAVGIGFELGFSLDVSGAISNAKTLINFGTDLISNPESTFDKLKEDFSNTDVGKNIIDGVEKVSGWFESGWDRLSGLF